VAIAKGSQAIRAHLGILRVADADESLVKQAHDEGGHPKIGAELAKRYGETSKEVLHAILGHHDDITVDHVYVEGTDGHGVETYGVDGITIGTITVLDSKARKPRYALQAAGQRVGTIVNDRWWSLHHHVLDAHEREVVRVVPRCSGCHSNRLRSKYWTV
jgi:hypothetical protein